jgi:hypothetical protein
MPTGLQLDLSVARNRMLKGASRRAHLACNTCHAMSMLLTLRMSASDASDESANAASMAHDGEQLKSRVTDLPALSPSHLPQPSR